MHNVARVMELVDVADSKSAAARRAGSSPASGTTISIKSTDLSVLFSFQSRALTQQARQFLLEMVQ
jgi:hypothetical protein